MLPNGPNSPFESLVGFPIVPPLSVPPLRSVFCLMPLSSQPHPTSPSSPPTGCLRLVAILNHRFRWLVMFAVVLGLVVHSGCMQRRILVRSNPEGALVTIDQVPVGHSPVAVPFTYYGTREIRVEKDGYQTQKIKHRFAPPWYQIPPLDFISDNFWPREIHDDRIVDFSLSPMELVNENRLLDRADQLRGNASRGTVPMPLAHERPAPAIDTPPTSQASSPTVLDRFR